METNERGSASRLRGRETEDRKKDPEGTRLPDHPTAKQSVTVEGFRQMKWIVLRLASFAVLVALVGNGILLALQEGFTTQLPILFIQFAVWCIHFGFILVRERMDPLARNLSLPGSSADLSGSAADKLPSSNCGAFRGPAGASARTHPGLSSICGANRGPAGASAWKYPGLSSIGADHTSSLFHSDNAVADAIHLVVHLLLLVTAGQVTFFFVPLMLPIAWISLSQGFRRTLFWVALAFGCQLAVQAVLLIPAVRGLGLQGQTEPALLILSLLLQYGLFILLFRLLGKAHLRFRQSEEDNQLLVERLGDKYVQLEEARREMQAQYDRLRVANEQTEESNKKLTSSLAEFFTIQQISQAISSIFEMNELLKFVNDVIIGVMGVSNSTIAMRNQQTDRMKVLVSSIIDKRELAVFTDYINHDIRNGCLSTNTSVLDNLVTSDAYCFVQGREVRSIVSVPLVAKGNALGIVLVEQVIPDAFSNETVRLLEIIAQQISIAIDNARLYQQMQEMATVDGLTGAFNRIHFQSRLTEAFKEAQLRGEELSLVIFDIDHFKRVNDRHGHQFGDLVLKTLTAYTKQHLRKTDLFARYGGEEFVILMPHTNRRVAYDKAEELRQGIERILVSDQLMSDSVTVSMGVSSFPEAARTEAMLIKTADEALYEAKNAGRNLVRLSGISSHSMDEPLS